MNITELAKKPQLVELILDAPELVEKYGEPIKFHIYDRQPLDVFAKLSALTEENSSEIAKIVESLILDEKGQPVVKDDNTLPMDVLVSAMTSISTVLGK